MNKRNDNKTQPTDLDPGAFITSLTHKTRKRDARTLLELFSDITGERAVMWGDSIIGFGQYHYKYDSGREGDFLKTGFSPRKQSMTIYAMTGAKRRPDLLEKLGPHKASVGCIYVTDLSKIDLDVLGEIVSEDYRIMTEKYG